MMVMPMPTGSACHGLEGWNLPTRKMRNQLKARLSIPQSTLTVDEESPLPGGFAKGLWKGRPEMPLVR